MTHQGERRYRLFFALWPDAHTQKAMAHTLRQLRHPRGRAVAIDKYHVTLAFLGDVEKDSLTCLCEQAAQLSFPSCTLSMDRFGQFRRAGILWLGCSETPESLQGFRQSLEQALVPCGYRPEQRPFRPHITLFRHFMGRLAATEIAPVEWQIRNFHLVLSESHNGGVIYQSIAVFPRAGHHT